MISSGFVAMLVIVARGFVGAGANGRQGLAFDDGIFWVWGEAMEVEGERLRETVGGEAYFPHKFLAKGSQDQKGRSVRFSHIVLG